MDSRLRGIPFFCHSDSYTTPMVYTAIVEQDMATGLFVGYVPGFPGAHSQAKTLDELRHNLQEVIEMLVEDELPRIEAEFVGTQQIVIP